MEVVILPSAAAAGALAAQAIRELLAAKPAAVLGLATGSSPLPVYDALARMQAAGEVSFEHASAFALDEYVGLPAGHPAGYRAVIRTEFTERVDMPPASVHVPDGHATDLQAACREYEASIAAAGGVDLQLLGIGSDGHIGFNEPGSSLASRTRVKTLTERTRADNARFFDGELDQVPRHCLTQGLGTIMESRHAVLLASGPGKADAVRAMVEGPVSARCPASVLQFHPHATVLLDEAAAAKLELTDYYRYTYANKPAWQGI